VPPSIGPAARGWFPVIQVADEAADEQFRDALAAFVPPAHVERLSALYAEVRSGVTDVVHDTVPRLLGRPARTFQQFTFDYKAAWA
jgi:hypothetical protein